MKNILAEKIWPVAQPILQKEKQLTGRPEYNVKSTFFGIMYVLENGIKWRCLPSEYGKVSTIHGKFMRWIREGRIQSIFENVRNEYLLVTDAFKNWYAVDTSYCKAPYAKNSGKNPTDRGKRGIKKNLAIDSRGAPLAVGIAPANRHDSKTLLDIIKSIKQIKRSLFSIVAADSAYDAKGLRSESLKDGFILHASTNRRRNQAKEIVRPKGRWKVEATHSWLNNFRSLKICYAKSDLAFLGFLQIAAAVQLFRMI